jgi:hypothetical protein
VLLGRACGKRAFQCAPLEVDPSTTASELYDAGKVVVGVWSLGIGEGWWSVVLRFDVVFSCGE